VEAIVFPIRFLRRAVNLTAGHQLSFAEIVAMVGEAKPDH
jgi:hypothetical protein